MVSDNKAASMFFLKENAVCFGALGTDSSANILEIQLILLSPCRKKTMHEEDKYSAELLLHVNSIISVTRIKVGAV